MKHIKLISIFLFMVYGFSGKTQNETPISDFPDFNNINMPESPIPRQFKIMGDIEVNLAKGIPIIQIPLYTFNLDGVEVPISISYDASGIKVDQMASPVGLGWTLNAGGAINRTVRGWPDENPGYWGWFNYGFLDDNYYSTHNNENDHYWQNSMQGTIANDFKGLAYHVDHNPDLFNYSFLSYSGSFIQDTETNMIKEQEDGLTVDSFLNIGDALSAKDIRGNKYFFNPIDNETSNNIRVSGNNDLESRNWDAEVGFVPVTSWKLSKIMSKNGKTINFSYDDQRIQYSANRISSTLTMGPDCNDDRRYPILPIKKASFTSTDFDFVTKQIKKIHSPESNITINFIYDKDIGLPDDVQHLKLSKIIISDTTSQEKKKIFQFYYDRFSGDPRLKLLSVQETVYEDEESYSLPPYNFEYQSGSLVKKDSKSIDLYGYYNGYYNGSKSVPHMPAGLPPY